MSLDKSCSFVHMTINKKLFPYMICAPVNKKNCISEEFKIP